MHRHSYISWWTSELTKFPSTLGTLPLFCLFISKNDFVEIKTKSYILFKSNHFNTIQHYIYFNYTTPIDIQSIYIHRNALLSFH
jgi:hypothetical protein